MKKWTKAEKKFNEKNIELGVTQVFTHSSIERLSLKNYGKDKKKLFH